MTRSCGPRLHDVYAGHDPVSDRSRTRASGQPVVRSKDFFGKLENGRRGTREEPRRGVVQPRARGKEVAC